MKSMKILRQIFLVREFLSYARHVNLNIVGTNSFYAIDVPFLQALIF